jgi:hypothetical protein
MASRESLTAVAKSLPLRAHNSAVIVWHSNDTTPMAARKRCSNVVGNVSFVNRTRQSGGYVAQHMFSEDARGGSVIVLAERQRVIDKSALTHFETYRQLFAYPRNIMTSGIMVYAHVWDGALFSSCDRLHRQLMAAYSHQLSAELGEGDAPLNELTHWYVSAKCVFHLAHGGLKRGMLELAEDRHLRKCAWVALESLRSSFGQLVSNAPAWIQARLFFEDWDMNYQADVWRALGVETELAERLVDLQLRWDPPTAN